MFLAMWGWRACLLMACVSTAVAAAAPPNSLDAARVHDLTLDGLEHAYNFDFAGAEERFDRAISAEPLHPRPYLSKAAVSLWRYLLDRSDEERERFLSLAETTIDVCDRYVAAFGKDAEVTTCLGTVYGYRSIAAGRSRSYLKAAWDGRKSYEALEEALTIDPHAYDAYLGIGVLHTMSSFLPTGLRWVVAVLGISGDSRLGLREIRLAAEKGEFSKVEARFALAQFLPWSDGDFAASEQLLSELSASYPSNELFIFTLAAWEIRRNDVRSASLRLKPLADDTSRTFGGLRQYALYKLGECLFRLERWDEARAACDGFLQVYREENYRATALYRIGVCLELTGNRSGAVTMYRAAAASETKFGDDAYSARRAARRIGSPLSDADTLLLHAQNLLRSGDAAPAVERFRALQLRPDCPPDLRAEALYGMGESLFESGSYAGALVCFQRAAETVPENEPWLRPWSHYQSGLCQLKLSDRAAARNEFEQTSEDDEYDFKNWLRFRTERELEKLQ